METDIRGNEQMARTKENISNHVTVEKSALGERVWVVHDSDKLSAKDMQEIRDAATAKGAKVEIAPKDRERSVDAPPAASAKEQAYAKARDSGFER